MSKKKVKDAVVKPEGVEGRAQVGRPAAKGAVRKNPRKGRRKFGYESEKGNEFSVDGRFVYKEQVIDRDSDFYKKLVIDQDTGEVLRDVEHKLSEHTDRGSAKKRNKI